jgi:hypothetical protein
MFAKHMTPLSKGGQTTAHKGKGSQQAGMPDRSQINSLATQPGINNYAKASPMGMPSPGQPPGGLPSGPPGIGTGNFSGNGG